MSRRRGGFGGARLGMALASCAALLLALVPGSCSDGGPDMATRRLQDRVRGRVVPIAFQPLGPAPGREPAVIERWVPELGDTAWRVAAPGFELLALPSGAVVLRLGASAPGDLLTVSRVGAFDGDRISGVVVTSALEGDGLLFVDCLRDGVLLGSSAGHAPPAAPGLSAVSISLPAAVLDGGPFDELRLRCEGGHRRLDVAAVALLDSPVVTRLTPQVGGAGGPPFATLGAEARPAQVLLAKRPLVGQVQVPPPVAGPGGGQLAGPAASQAAAGPVLRICAAPASQLRRRERASSVVLRAARGERTEILAELPLGARDAEYVQLDVALPPWIAEAGGELTLRVEARGAGADAACLLGPVALIERSAAPPTLVLITSADHRADHLARHFGGIDIETPALDALARGGLHLRGALAAGTAAPGALAALHTGRSPRETGLLGIPDRLAGDARTLAEVLAERGWAAAAVLGSTEVGPASGQCQGFGVVRLPSSGSRAAAGEVLTSAARLLALHAGLPLFLWIHFADGTWPHQPHERLLDAYYDRQDDPFLESLRVLKVPDSALPPELDGLRDLDWPRARYKACLTAVDEALGSLMRHPRVAGGLTAFSGVTGMHLGEHGVWFKRLGLYPGALAVPLVLSGPGLPRGLRVDEPVAAADLGRTLLDLLGEEAVPFPGRNLLGAAAAGAPPTVFAVDVSGLAASATRGSSHLVLTLQPRDLAFLPEHRQRGEREFYDLSSDPLAERDLLAQGGDDLARLTRELMDWLEQSEDLGWSMPGPLSSAEHERLSAVGYLVPPPPVSVAPWDLTPARR